MRVLVALLGVVCSAAFLLGSVSSAPAGDELLDAVSGQELRRGAGLFQRTCAACHGMRGQGRPGAGVTAGPPIDDVEVAYVDLVLRTGRMPIAHREAGVREQRLGDRDRVAVTAWMREAFGLPGGIPTVVRGDAGAGLDHYVRHCAACHGAGGEGGVAGGATFVPGIRGSDALTVAEAVRVGPFAMPAFSEEILTPREVGDVVAYLDEAGSASRTLAGLHAVDPVATGIASLVLVAGVVGVVRGIARSTAETGSVDER